MPKLVREQRAVRLRSPPCGEVRSTHVRISREFQLHVADRVLVGLVIALAGDAQRAASRDDLHQLRCDFRRADLAHETCGAFRAGTPGVSQAVPQGVHQDAKRTDVRQCCFPSTGARRRQLSQGVRDRSRHAVHNRVRLVGLLLLLVGRQLEVRAAAECALQQVHSVVWSQRRAFCLPQRGLRKWHQRLRQPDDCRRAGSHQVGESAARLRRVGVVHGVDHRRHDVLQRVDGSVHLLLRNVWLVDHPVGDTQDSGHVLFCLLLRLGVPFVAGWSEQDGRKDTEAITRLDVARSQLGVGGALQLRHPSLQAVRPVELGHDLGDQVHWHAVSRVHARHGHEGVAQSCQDRVVRCEDALAEIRPQHFEVMHVEAGERRNRREPSKHVQHQVHGMHRLLRANPLDEGSEEGAAVFRRHVGEDGLDEAAHVHARHAVLSLRHLLLVVIVTAADLHSSQLLVHEAALVGIDALLLDALEVCR